MAHSRVSPSAAGRWSRCAGSVIMGEQFPETGRSESAEEGTAAHWVASEVLSGRGASPFEGRTAPNGIIITSEMVDAAKVYVQAVFDVVPSVSDRMIEKPMVIPRIHPECHGTPDCWAFLTGAMELHVWDLKYGFGIVEPEENQQMICYIAGAMDQVAEFMKSPVGVLDQHITVVAHIVQPRPFHVLGPHRVWRIPAVELRGPINFLAAKAQEALGPNPQCLSGEQCLYCSARHACPAAQKAAMRAIDYVSMAVPELLSPMAMGIEYRTLQRCVSAMKSRMAGLETQLITMLNQGQGSECGLSLEVGNGRERWSKPIEEIFAMGDLMGVDLRDKPQAITPAQARKAGMPKELVTLYTEIPNNGYRLVDAGSTIAAKAFGK